MDMLTAYRKVGSYRGAAEICGTTHKTVRRVVERHNADGVPERKNRGHNHDNVRGLVAEQRKEVFWPDLSEAAAAGRPCRQLPGVRGELPPLGRRGEGRVAGPASPRPPPGGMDAGRHAGHRLGRRGLPPSWEGQTQAISRRTERQFGRATSSHLRDQVANHNGSGVTAAPLPVTFRYRAGRLRAVHHGQQWANSSGADIGVRGQRRARPGRPTTAPGRPPPSPVLPGMPALRDLRSARAARLAQVSVPGLGRQALPPAGARSLGKELPAEGNRLSGQHVNDISPTVGDSTTRRIHEPHTQHIPTASHRFPTVPPPPRMARSRSSHRPPTVVAGSRRG
jgi:hypothetical protein